MRIVVDAIKKLLKKVYVFLRLDKAMTFLREVRRELAFVTWPTRREIADSTKIVFVTVLVFGLYIALLDVVFAHVFQFIASLFS